MVERRPVLHIVPAAPFGGAQRLVIDLAAEQQGNGRNTAVLFLGAGDQAAEACAAKEVEAIFPLGAETSLSAKVQRVRQVLRDRAGTIVHVHLPPPWLYFALPRRSGKVVLHLHCRPPLAVHSRNIRMLAGQFFLGRMASRSDHLLAISEWIRDSYRGAFPALQTPFSIVYNGASFPDHVSRHSLDREHPVFGMACRIAPMKGLDEFIELAVAIKDRVPGAHFRIAGEGDAGYRASLLRVAKQHGIADSIQFVGFVSDIATFWSGIDMGLFTAPFEPFGLRLIEPLACGVPVAAYRNGSGSDEIADRCQAIVTAPYPEADALAGRIEAELSASNRIEALSRIGEEEVRSQFSNHRMMLEIDAIYRTLV